MLNKVILMGRLTRDPETKIFESGSKLANFNLAVSRRFQKDGEDKADFIPIRVWGKQADFAENYFCKGKQVYVVGSLETYSYEKDGENRSGFRINADEIGFADTKNKEGTNQSNTDTAQETKSDDFSFNMSNPMGDFGFNEMSGEDDDLPF